MLYLIYLKYLIVLLENFWKETKQYWEIKIGNGLMENKRYILSFFGWMVKFDAMASFKLSNTEKLIEKIIQTPLYSFLDQSKCVLVLH